MQDVNNLSRAARALHVAQRCAPESVFSEVTNRLRDEPCVSFVLDCKGGFDLGSEVDIAVRMLSIATRNRPVDHGHLIWELDPKHVTPLAIESGLQAVASCVSDLKKSHQPFAFLAHIEGQTSIKFCHQGDDYDSALSQLAHAIADEVRSLTV